MPEYFDFHSHIYFPKFANDIDEVLTRMRGHKVGTIVVGTDLEQSKKALEFAKKHDGVFASVGLHPADNTKEFFDEKKYEEFLLDENVVMIGECGLDYFHEKDEGERARQRKEFEKQIDFAVAHNKPIMLHIREAHKDGLDMLCSKKKEYGDRLHGNAHFFTESSDIAKQYYELDFTTSFPGVITFTHDYDETVKYAPKDMILSETDSPYVAPESHRGKRNEPVFVIEIVKKMAEIRGEDVEELKKQLVKNALRFLK
ncbi:MAG TPA: TatD family deoxyribonuclease [Candidatus Kaiserbacteria bacterium]|nr:TatD family deoxyribonuclease [Candidatus Kaiserbacteria bacterium]